VPLIPTLVNFAPGAIIKSDDVDGNFSAVRDTVNAFAAFRDVANVWTLPQTFNAGLTASSATINGAVAINGSSSFSAPVTLTSTLAASGLVTFTGGLTITGATPLKADHAEFTDVRVSTIYGKLPTAAPEPILFYDDAIGWKFSDTSNVKLIIGANRVITIPVGGGKLDTNLIARVSAPANDGDITIGGGSSGTLTSGGSIQCIGNAVPTFNGQVWIDGGTPNGTINFRTNATVRGTVQANGVLVWSSDVRITGSRLFLDTTVTANAGTRAVIVPTYANGGAFSSVDNAGTQVVNMLGLNAGDRITIGPASASNVVIGVASSTLSFFAATPVAKQTVTGAKGGNVALGVLIGVLQLYGLINDSTTA